MKKKKDGGRSDLQQGSKAGDAEIAWLQSEFQKVVEKERERRKQGNQEGWRRESLSERKGEPGESKRRKETSERGSERAEGHQQTYRREEEAEKTKGELL